MTTTTFLQHVPPQQYWQQEYCMRPGPAYAGIQKSGRTSRNPPAHGGANNTTMSSGSEDRSRDRSRATDQASRRTSTRRQMITFVDSQDPNSRSTIQRHTAQHSNAQRRDARLQSLRNTSRPRVLRWTRRQSAEALPVTSSASSNSSPSISPLPPLERPPSQSEENTTQPTATPERPIPVRDQYSPEKESAVQFLVDFLCRHCPDRDTCEEIINYTRTDKACTNLLLAYSISLRRHNSGGTSSEADDNAARNYLNQGTSLLRARLSDPLLASADANIQAVLLLIAYTADYGISSFDEVRIHANALRTMIDQRGGVGEENYPPILARQLRSIGSSRFYHLTLDCREPCEALMRFPRGLYEV